jgi:hypothetical protein
MAAFTYTIANITLSVRALLRETTASFWSDAQLAVYVNEAVRTIAERVGAYRTTTTVDTVAATRTVSYTGYKCLAVEYNSKALIKITPLQIGHVKIDGVAPQYWFETANLIGIEPIPPLVYTLTLYLASIPVTVSGATLPSIPYALCSILKYYAVSRALAQDRKFAASNMFMGIFNSELEFMSQTLLPNIPDSTEDVRFQ